MCPPPLPLGQSPSVRNLYRLAQRLARVKDAVLLIGEPGTGKTFLARWMHDQGRHRSGAFVKVPATSVPPGMEYATFAGHVRGAFTGADGDKRGLVEAAHRGTLFVDEVGLATEPVQRILLQLLDDRTVTRVGDERPRPVDVRFIAATNEDLEAGTRAGTFRRDLLERFGYFILRVPSLASRRDQILPIARHALAKASDEYGRASAPVLSAQVSDALLHAPWPGNIRQLVSLCRYVALNTEEGRPAMLDDLPPEFTLGQGKPPRRRVTDAAIDSALADNDGNRTKAAASLGMSREHLQRRMRRQ